LRRIKYIDHIIKSEIHHEIYSNEYEEISKIFSEEIKCGKFKKNDDGDMIKCLYELIKDESIICILKFINELTRDVIIY
jgi:hypothetical protein